MKKPDRLVGYLNINDSNCAFEFNDDDFTLSLYPPDTKGYDTHSIFNVQDLPSNYNGFKVYNVNWYFCYHDTIKANSIEDFRIRGRNAG